MDNDSFWHWAKQISSAVVMTCVCLYVIRCLRTVNVVSLDAFDQYMKGLLRYIFA